MDSSSASDNGSYPAFCRIAAQDSSVFNSFRSNDTYQQILEHFDFDAGLRFLEVIELKYPRLLTHLERYAIADRVGGATRHTFKGYGRFSASTIRYICHLGNILEHFPDLAGMNIIEVGGGYGGLASIICTHANIKSYTIVDLPDVMRLANRWLSETLPPETKAKIGFWNQSTRTETKQWDLFVSNFAFTECSPAVQDCYIDTIIKRSSAGFILYNFRAESYHPSILLTKLQRATSQVRCYDECPLTCPTNMLIVFAKSFKRGNDRPLPFFAQRALYRISPQALAFLKRLKMRLALSA